VLTGDACVNGPFNAMADSDTASWIQVLGKVQRLAPEIVVPGQAERRRRMPLRSVLFWAAVIVAAIALLVLSDQASAENWVGTSHHDFRWGTPTRDYYQGRGGRDTLYGRGGPDDLDGNGGNDYLVGGAGDDYLWGMYGNDTIRGGLGYDVCKGGPGVDDISGCEFIL